MDHSLTHFDPTDSSTYCYLTMIKKAIKRGNKDSMVGNASV